MCQWWLAHNGCVGCWWVGSGLFAGVGCLGAAAGVVMCECRLAHCWRRAVVFWEVRWGCWGVGVSDAGGVGYVCVAAGT